MRNLLLILIGVLGSWVFPSAGGAQDLRISGTLVDAITGIPLSGGEVSINAIYSGSPVPAVLTATDGRFLFEHLKPGKYILSASRRGYAAQNLDQHGAFTTGVAVGPGLDSERIVFRLQPSASISGQVTDEFSDNVRGAVIMLFSDDLRDGGRGIFVRQRTSTNDEGRYRFDRLSSGRYFVAVVTQPWYRTQRQNVGMMYDSRSGRARGPIRSVESSVSDDSALDVLYPIQYYSGAADPAGASPIALKAGEHATADFALFPVPALRLTVTGLGADADARGISFEVEQILPGGEREQIPISIDNRDTNAIQISGIPPGHVVLTYTPSNGDANQSVRQEFDASRDAEITLPRGSHGPSVSGVVQLPESLRGDLQGVIALRNVTTGETIATNSTPNGTFNFLGNRVPPGAYEVAANAFQDAFLARLSAVGAKVSGRTMDIVGSGPVTLTLELTRGRAQIEGVVLRDGNPVAGAMVLLVPAAGNGAPSNYLRDQSDSDGTFSLAGVVPGDYVLVAIQNGWDLEWARPEVLKPFLARGEKLKVIANGLHKATLHVQ